MSILFEKRGRENTEEVLKLAAEAAEKAGIRYLVLSSTFGDSAEKLLAMERTEGLHYVVVTSAYGVSAPNENRFPDELRQRCEAAGIRVCTAAHALSGAERGISSRFKGAYPVEIIAHTLRMFGQGTKVCVEVAAMAADAGLVPAGEPIVAMGGTGTGLDTAVVMEAAYSASILDTRVIDFICKADNR